MKRPKGVSGDAAVRKPGKDRTAGGGHRHRDRSEGGAGTPHFSKGDTVSYNANAFKVTADADVEGLLKKMPGITVNNGAVEAQGETIQKVFVDGKEFFGEDVTSAIKSLPAEAVERIEVYNKLSDQAEFSGMDDGESYKAINIVTRENMRQGIFGKAYAGYGYDADTLDSHLHQEHKHRHFGDIGENHNSLMRRKPLICYESV